MLDVQFVSWRSEQNNRDSKYYWSPYVTCKIKLLFYSCSTTEWNIEIFQNGNFCVNRIVSLLLAKWYNKVVQPSANLMEFLFKIAADKKALIW